MFIPIFIASILIVGADNPTPPAAPSKPYTMTTSITPADFGIGATDKFTLTIAPQSPFLLKPETPFKASLTATEGLQIAKSELTAKDFVDNKTSAKTVATEVTTRKAGKQQLNVEVSFFLCTDEMCQRFTDRAVAAVDIH